MRAAIWNARWWTNAHDRNFLEYELEKMAKAADFTIVKRVRHDFAPFGYTALWLLSESHLAVHTFPECGKAYIELSSCIKEKFDIFCALVESNKTIAPTGENGLDKSEVLPYAMD